MIDLVMKALGILLIFSGGCLMWTTGDRKGRVARVLLYALLWYFIIEYRPIHADPDDGPYPDITEYSPE